MIQQKKIIKYSLLIASFYVLTKQLQKIYQKRKLKSFLSQLSRHSVDKRNNKIEQFMIKYGAEFDRVFQTYFQNADDQQIKESHQILQNGDLQQIRNLIEQKRIKISDILLMYILIIQYLTQSVPTSSYIADVQYQEAMDLALQQEQLLIQNPDILKQQGNELMGIPIIVQDNFTVQGMNQTFGCQYYAQYIPNLNSDLIKAIQTAGGIIFAKANVPQTALSLQQDTKNNVYGDAHHKSGQIYSCGYQSGSLATLILQTSAIGLGSDIDGSLRVSAQFNNLTSFKPTSTRVAREKIELQIQGNQFIRPSHGFLSTSVNSLQIMTQVVFNYQISQSLYDPFCSRIKYNQNKGRQNIKFGYYNKFTKMPTCKSLQISLDQVVQKLKVQKLEVKEFQFEEALIEELVVSYFKILYCDFWQMKAKLLNQETDKLNQFSIIEQMLGQLLLIIQYFMRERAYDVMQIKENIKLSTQEVLSIQQKVLRIRQRFCQSMIEQNIDVLLLPAGITPAFYQGLEFFLHSNDYPNVMINALDLPCGFIPTGQKIAEQNQNQRKDQFYLLLHMCFQSLQNVQVPHGIQIVSLPNNDELCLSAMKIIEKLRQDNENF